MNQKNYISTTVMGRLWAGERRYFITDVRPMKKFDDLAPGISFYGFPMTVVGATATDPIYGYPRRITILGDYVLEHVTKTQVLTQMLTHPIKVSADEVNALLAEGDHYD